MPDLEKKDWTLDDAIASAIGYCYTELRPWEHPNIRVSFEGAIHDGTILWCDDLCDAQDGLVYIMVNDLWP